MLDFSTATAQTVRATRRSRETLRTADRLTAQNTLNATNATSVTLDAQMRLRLGLTVDETADWTDTAVATLRILRRVVERLQAQAAPGFEAGTMSGTVRDRLSLSDAIRVVAHLLAANDFDVESASPASLTATFLVAELLRTASGVSNTATMAGQLAELLAASSAAIYVAELSADEVASLADALSTAIRARFTADSTLALADALAGGLSILIPDAFSASESTSPDVAVYLSAAERLAFIGRLALPEGAFSAWVLNADTTGVTSYSNFPFNSLATHRGVTYGLTETGLYELTGDTDDGTPIEAHLRTGDLDFGTSRDKNIPRAYLNLLTSGQVVLKTISSIRGARTERWYELAPKAGNDEALRRVPLARGLRGATWAFEVRNLEGATFEFSDAEVLPVVLSRRGG